MILPLPLRVESTSMHGRPVVVVRYDIPDDAPTFVREGLARRAMVARGEACPCGAGLRLADRRARRRAMKRGSINVIRVEHERGCPAITADLNAAIRRWKGASP